MIKGSNNTVLSLKVNIDGLPLGKSSEKNLWLILCLDKDDNNVYVIGVYCGEKKPEDPNEYLNFFVEDVILLINQGFFVHDTLYEIHIYALVCDAPAKAFVLCVKNHSGYDSCTKCLIEGEMHDCVCFPEKNQKLRTDEEFKNFNYSENYQKKNLFYVKFQILDL